MPGEGKVGIALQRLLQRGERFAIASQLDQRGALEGEWEGGEPEVAERALGEAQRVLGAVMKPQQLEAFCPARLEIGMRGEHAAVRLLRVGDPPLAREPAGAGDGALARRVRKQVVRRRRPHRANISAPWLLARRVRGV